MPEVFFSHPVIDKERGALRIETGANEITWGYGLNTQTYPTYGGEVVQVLSAYTDDLQIQGEVRTYAKMERIYEWFLSYLQVATQTGDSNGRHSFDQHAITFAYPERGWEQKILVTQLPGFKYGRDVVVPQYQITAHVVEQDPHINKHIVSTSLDILKDFERVTAGIGYIEENPFSNPFPKLSQDQIDSKTGEELSKIADYYTQFISSYASGDFGSVIEDYGSVPAFLGGGTGAQGSATNQAGNDINNGATTDGSSKKRK